MKNNEMKRKLEEGQIVLCTVDRIRGTIVFVKIEEYNLEGTITFPEISPGRIRNIRDYVFPGKKIVCKILRIKPEGVDLSLRRVKLKEKKEFNETLKKEKNYKALLKTVLKEEASQIIEKIKESEESLVETLDNAKEDLKILEKFMPKQDAEKIIKILQEKKQKEILLKHRLSLSSKDSKGIILIKDIIKQATKEYNECEVSYVAAGQYLIKIKAMDPKKGDQHLTQIIQNIEKLAAEKKCTFSSKKA